MNNKGLLVGSSTVFGTGALKSSLPVPYALAKCIEYFMPYKNKISASIKDNYADPFPTVTSYTNSGIGTKSPCYPRVGYPQWQFYPVVVETGTTTAPNLVKLDAVGTGNNTFLQFIATEGLVSQIGTAIQRRRRVLPISKIPSAAPDSSVYARAANSPLGANGGEGGVYGLDSNFDPELTIMFNPIKEETGNFSTTNAKSYPRSIIDYREDPGNGMSDVFQIASVFVALCQDSKETYRAGKVRDVFTLCGQNLKTLYPTPQGVDGRSLAENVQAEYAQTLSNKSAAYGADNEQKFITLLATAAYHKLQKKLNYSEVIHINCPVVAASVLGADPVYCPQVFYVDESWDNINLPLLEAGCCSAIGYVVNDGVLKVPVCGYDGMVSHETVPDSVIGPMDWSAYGFTTNNDTYFPTNNLYTTPWGVTNPASAADCPNLVIDTTTSSNTECNQAFVTSYYGAQPLPDPSFTSVYPFMFNGPPARVIQQSYTTYMASSINAQTMALAPVNDTEEGYRPVMNGNSNFTEQGVGKGSSIPYTMNTGGTTDSANNLFISVGPASVGFDEPPTKEEASLSVVFHNGDIDSQPSSPSNVKEYYKKLKVWMVTGVGLKPPPPLGGTFDANNRFTMNVPVLGGLQGILGGLAQTTTSTSNPLRSILQREQVKPGFNVLKFIEKELGPQLRTIVSDVDSNNMRIQDYIGGQRTKNVKKSKGKSGFAKVLDTGMGVLNAGKDIYKFGKGVMELVA